MSSSPLSPQILDAFAAQLTSALRRLSTQRYEGPVSLTRLASSTASPTTLHFHLGTLDSAPVTIDMTTTHVGGNVCDMEVTFDGGPRLKRPYCLPDPAPVLIPNVPSKLPRTIAAFLLDTLEQRLGHRLLRDFLQRKRAAADPTSATAARSRSR